ncbi:MAG: hypothetical protein LBI93_00610 [Endomicrobium sp.]|nr:hypothetical protein [Endomicrobium sp.]
MKGLNLYDNPFTMDAQFAEDLTNFMPPTTELKVRPGVVKLTSFYGAIRGMFSYAVGQVKNYGKNWYDQTISEGEYQSLLLKIVQGNGNSLIYSYNPLNNQYDVLQEVKEGEYSKDFAIYKHSLMMCVSKPELPMYIWSARNGWKNMKWVAPDNSTELTDLQNITFYNGMCLSNATGTFDIFICDATKINPQDPSLWDKAWSWFSPKFLGNMQISLEGIAKKGGSIMKMFTISKSGIETINSYFCVCTTLGEIIVWQGELKNPSSEVLLKNPNADPIADFQLVGRFEIPIPLNNNCFCQMEGDIIVATQNGLFSLNRVIFGQQTEITQSLESRINNVFSNYMFKDNAYQKFFGLFYYQKSRLLIFNVPDRMPQTLQSIGVGTLIAKGDELVLGSLSNDFVSTVIAGLKNFIGSYLYYHWIDYTLFIQFDDSAGKIIDEYLGIFAQFVTKEVTDPENPYKVTTQVTFFLQELLSSGIKKTELLAQPLVFTCPDFTAAVPSITFTNNLSWNESLKKTYQNITSYSYMFKESEAGDNADVVDTTITNVIPITKFFAHPTASSPFSNIYEGMQVNLDNIRLSYLAVNPLLPDLEPNTRAFFLRFGQKGFYPDGDLLDEIGVLEGNLYLDRAKNELVPQGTSPVAQIFFREITNHIPDFMGLAAQNYEYRYTFTLAEEITGKTREISARLFATMSQFSRQDTAYQCNIDMSMGWYVDDTAIPVSLTFNNAATVNNAIYKFPGYCIFLTSLWGFTEMASRSSTSGDYEFKDFTFNEGTILESSDGNGFKVVSIKTEWVSCPYFKDALVNAGLTEEHQTEDNYEQMVTKFGYTLAPFVCDITEAPPTPPTPPVPISINVEDLIEGSNLNAPLSLDFSGNIDDINYDEFQYKSYNDFSSKLNSYWCQNGTEYSGDQFLARPAFTPFGLDLVKEVGSVFVVNGDFFSLNPPAFTYEIKYVFSSQNLAQEHSLRLRFYFYYTKTSLGDTFVIGTSYNGEDSGFFWDDERIAPVSSRNFFMKNIVAFYPPLSYYLVIAADPTTTMSPKTIFDFTGSNDWVVKEISAEMIYTSGAETEEYFVDALPTFKHVTKDNIEAFKAAYGYLMSGFWISPNDPEKEKKEHNNWADIFMPKTKLIEVKSKDLARIKEHRASRGDSPLPISAVQVANFSLDVIPIFAGSHLLTNFRSVQYVMNSYYGTWSKWEDVNMIDGISHLGEFYFVKPEDIPDRSGTSFTYNTSVLCKFDDMAFGDYDKKGTLPIQISYQTPANNLGINQYKLLERIKILATQSTFWGTQANYLRITMFSDFGQNPTYWYQHSSEIGKQRIMKLLKLNEEKELHELSFQEMKKFKELYATESSTIKHVDMGLLCSPLNRLSLKVEMDIKEANIIIYGYEIYLKIMNKV